MRGPRARRILNARYAAVKSAPLDIWRETTAPDPPGGRSVGSAEVPCALRGFSVPRRSGEPWVARSFLQRNYLVDPVPAFAETRSAFKEALSCSPSYRRGNIAFGVSPLRL